MLCTNSLFGIMYIQDGTRSPFFGRRNMELRKQKPSVAKETPSKRRRRNCKDR